MDRDGSVEYDEEKGHPMWKGDAMVADAACSWSVHKAVAPPRLNVEL